MSFDSLCRPYKRAKDEACGGISFVLIPPQGESVRYRAARAQEGAKFPAPT